MPKSVFIEVQWNPENPELSCVDGDDTFKVVGEKEEVEEVEDDWLIPSYTEVPKGKYIILERTQNTEWTCCSGWSKIAVEVVEEDPYLTRLPKFSEKEGISEFFLSYEDLIQIPEDEYDAWIFLKELRQERGVLEDSE